MNGTIRFGLLSFAHYHANFWAEAIADRDDAELVGVWDDHAARGKDAANKYDTRFFPALARLLDRCDAVGITSETARHADLVEEAAQVGVHVLLEKPMATTMTEALRIKKAVKDNDILFMQNFPKRYDPINHELSRLIQSGKMGTVTLVRVRHGNYHLLELGDKARAEWYTIPDLSGGGALIDEGIHAFDLLVWLFGVPEKVHAMTSTAGLHLPIEDTAVATCVYPSGMLAEIATSNIFTAGQDSVEIYGTGGTALLSGVDLASRDFSSAPYLRYFCFGEQRGTWQGSEVIPQFVRGKFHHQGPAGFIECLVDNTRAPVVDLEHSIQSVAILEACYRSVKTGGAELVRLR